MASRKESKTQRKQTLGTRITSTASAPRADRLDGAPSTNMPRSHSTEGNVFLS